MVPDGETLRHTAYNYDPYGNPTTTGTAVANPFQYAGQFVDLQSGLMYLRARWYDPTTAQFLSSDPITYITRHPYLYAMGDPMNRIDTSGLCASSSSSSTLSGLYAH